MEIHLLTNRADMGAAAAKHAAHLINKAINTAGEATIVVATGTSQFEMLNALVVQEVDWSRVTAFHLDEYIGLPASHPASFRKYLKKRFVDKLPDLQTFHEVDGEAVDPAEECERLNGIIEQLKIDVACVGIGENGHLAFNDPPANMDTDQPFIIVELDENCRAQQVGEGWFSSMADVPARAISMSVGQIMKGAGIVCTVPDRRKAEALRKTVEGSITPMVPASILQRHDNCHIFADEAAGYLLDN